jgi:hypothetical protein
MLFKNGNVKDFVIWVLMVHPLQLITYHTVLDI